jgi:hypothetical protein
MKKISLVRVNVMDEIYKALLMVFLTLNLFIVSLSYIYYAIPVFTGWWFGIDSNRFLKWFSVASLFSGFIALLYLQQYTVTVASGALETELLTRLSIIIFLETLWVPFVYYNTRKWWAVLILFSVCINAALLLWFIVKENPEDNLVLVSSVVLLVHVTLTDFFIWDYFYLTF